jgi:glyoxalase superfamily protein
MHSLTTQPGRPATYDGAVIRWVYAFIDRPLALLDSSVGFWTEVTGTTPEPQQDARFVRLRSPRSDDWLEVQGVLAGPGGTHLDFSVEDVPAFTATALAAGATVVADHGGWQVLRSPAGLPFCVARWEGQHVLPGAANGSLVDQVCLDIGPAAYESEVAFWTTVTGWEFADESREFDRLTPPTPLPVQLLLQRLDEERPAGAHLDLACFDRAAVRADHEKLGATFVSEGPGWIVMRDPAGGVYCLTRRLPRH